MKVLFLINDGFGIGGTIRTTFNLGGALAGRGHDVEVLSTLRRRDAPLMPVAPGVKLTALVEMRKDHPDYDAGNPLRGRPTVVYPSADYRAGDYDLMVEDLAEKYLRGSDADVVIGTRAGLIAYIARFAPDRMIRIGQEHLTRRQNRKALREAMPPFYRRLDAFVTVSARDAEDYRKHLTLPRTRLLFIPNSIPAPRVPPSHGRHNIVVAAGRLIANKRYDVLVRAFAKVVATRPDWQLRIYGNGVTAPELRALIRQLGLHNHVLMMGGYSPIEPEWAKGAIAAVPSDKEPFGMTLVEAMRCGVPVVSTDAPWGPAEILDDGVDGLLTPVGDPNAMADALLRMIGDEEQRRSMAAAALASSARYDPEPIARRYEELFEQLAADKAKRRNSLLARLRRRSPGTYPPGVALSPVAHNSLPLADCTSTDAGALELRLSGVPATAGSSLVWQRVGGGTPATVPITASLDETFTVGPDDVPAGSWLLHLDTTGGETTAGETTAGESTAGESTAGERVPVAAGLRDTRALLDTDPRPDGGVRVLLPYRSSEGFLGLRVWRRDGHAEVGDLEVTDRDIRVTGRLAGAARGTGPVAVELRRIGAEPLVETVPAGEHGDGGWTATVPADRLDALRRGTADEVWELWLRYDATAAPVRLGRLLDDVLDKRTAYVLPEVALDGARVTPFYTELNDLSVRVTRR